MLIFTLLDDLEIDLTIQDFELDVQMIDIEDIFYITDEIEWEINDGC